MALTIKKLIDLERLKGFRMVAGSINSNNEVHNINTIDNPDSYEWFTAGDFLLTTGYIYKDDPLLQKNLIKELAQMNISGLGIKIKRYWDEIPKVIIDQANQLNFPIIEIPFNYSLSQVTNIINDEIFKRESSELRKYKKIHDAFTRCSLSGGKLNEIAELTSNMIDNPVLLLDSHYNLLAYKDLKENPYPFKENLDLTLRTKPFDHAFNDSIPSDAKMFSLNIKRQLTINGQIITCRIKPIVYANIIYGYVVVWETVKKLNRLDYIAIESASSTAALERIKMQQIEESKNRQRKDFFDDLLEGRILSNNALRSMAQNYGLNPKNPHLVMVIKTFDVSSEEASKVLDVLQLLSNFNHRYPFQRIKRHDQFMLFFQVPKDEANIVPPKPLKDYIENTIIKRIDEVIPSKHQSGVSNVNDEFINIRNSAMLALQVIKLTLPKETKHKVSYFHDLISYHLIDSSIEKDVMLSYFEETLGPLYTYDQQHSSNLLETLQSYFENNENISLAAKKMYIHRNSFSYRLDKIKDILKTTLQNSEENFSLQFALKIHKILQLNRHQ